MSDSKQKYLQPVIIALSIAVISAAGTALFRHESMLLNLHRDFGAMDKKIYRLHMRNFEYHARYVEGELQVMELRRIKGQLSIVDQARIVFLKNVKETISQEKIRVTEEGVENG